MDHETRQAVTHSPGWQLEVYYQGEVCHMKSYA
jgi:hypothetical protein